MTGSPAFEFHNPDLSIEEPDLSGTGDEFYDQTDWLLFSVEISDLEAVEDSLIVGMKHLEDIIDG